MLDEEASRPFVKRAIERGINFFDTADMYSEGVSEEVLGRALKDFAARDQVVIASKALESENQPWSVRARWGERASWPSESAIATGETRSASQILEPAGPFRARE